MNRRSFIQSAVASSTALGRFNLAAQNSQGKPDICIFTKPFQYLNYSDYADLIAEIGADGVELPVRPKGHILPETAADELPKMVEELKKRDLNVTILASGINSIDSPHAEKVLRTAVVCGIRQYRILHYRYNLNEDIIPQIEGFKSKMIDLAAMNKEIGIQGLCQNHSGSSYFGAPLWDLFSCLKDLDKKYIASAFDIGHASIEGGKSWRIQQKLFEDYTAAVYVKDPSSKNGRFGWKPFGQGIIKQSFFDNVKKSGFKGPYSLHVEYLGRDKKDFAAIVAAFKKDLKALRSIVG